MEEQPVEELSLQQRVSRSLLHQQLLDKLFEVYFQNRASYKENEKIFKELEEHINKIFNSDVK